MHNVSYLIGRLVEKPTIQEVDGKKICDIQVASVRTYKNEQGEYETDIVPVRLWYPIASNLVGICEKGDLVGVKGRIQVEDGELMVVAEKVSILTSKNTGLDEE